MTKRRARTLVAVVIAAVAIACASAVPAGAGQPASSTATQHGLTVRLTATPASSQAGTTVHFVAQARTSADPGELVYGVDYGDGTIRQPVASPRDCRAGTGRPTSRTWRFTHQYRDSGTYRVRFGVAVNCNGASADVLLTVHVA